MGNPLLRQRRSEQRGGSAHPSRAGIAEADRAGRATSHQGRRAGTPAVAVLFGSCPPPELAPPHCRPRFPARDRGCRRACEVEPRSGRGDREGAVGAQPNRRRQPVRGVPRLGRPALLAHGRQDSAADQVADARALRELRARGGRSRRNWPIPSSCAASAPCSRALSPRPDRAPRGSHARRLIRRRARAAARAAPAARPAHRGGPALPVGRARRAPRRQAEQHRDGRAATSHRPEHRALGRARGPAARPIGTDAYMAPEQCDPGHGQGQSVPPPTSGAWAPPYTTPPPASCRSRARPVPGTARTRPCGSRSSSRARAAAEGRPRTARGSHPAHARQGPRERPGGRGRLALRPARRRRGIRAR